MVGVGDVGDVGGVGVVGGVGMEPGAEPGRESGDVCDCFLVRAAAAREDVTKTP